MSPFTLQQSWLKGQAPDIAFKNIVSNVANSSPAFNSIVFSDNNLKHVAFKVTLFYINVGNIGLAHHSLDKSIDLILISLLEAHYIFGMYSSAKTRFKAVFNKLRL